MGILRWMGPEGDTCLAWSEADTNSMAAVCARIARAVREGRGVFEVDEEGRAVRVDAFSPSAREVVVIPQVKGG